ncbi:DNA-directed RNA polymerase specialized sigma24 family protein [Paenibacillus sp. PvP094]|uniref:hypothetical protein n=1 Tax=Paenibacillus sp. PvP094 TaxID=3156394 RepID=UPI0033916A23
MTAKASLNRRKWISPLRKQKGSREQEAAADQEEGEQTQPAGDSEGASGKIDKDALEQYIITERPSFLDMPIDFPNLFEQKRDQGVTWREIANSVGLTSGQFSSLIRVCNSIKTLHTYPSRICCAKKI